jgi:hypothetical protein
MVLYPSVNPPLKSYGTSRRPCINWDIMTHIIFVAALTVKGTSNSIYTLDHRIGYGFFLVQLAIVNRKDLH